MNIKKHKNFVYLLPTPSVQCLTTIIQTISVTWYILNRFGETASGLYLALYFSCLLIPQILMGPLFGVFIDSCNRKNIVLAAAYVRSVCLLFLSFFLFLDFYPLVFLFVAVVANSAMSAFSTAATNAIIPNIVREEHLLNINSIISFNENFSFIFGAAIAGFLYSAVGIAGVFLINGSLYAVAGTLLLFLKIQRPASCFIEKEESKQAAVSATLFKKIISVLKDGFALISKDRPVFYIILLGLIVNFFLFPFDSILLPKVIKYTLHFEASKYGILQSIGYMGAILGLLIVVSIPKRNKLIYSIFRFAIFALAINIMLAGLSVSFTSLNIFGASSIYILLCTLGFIRFTFDSLLMIPIKTMYQKRIEDHLRGRFYGYMNTLWVGLQPIGAGIIGILTSAGYFSYGSIIVALGTLIFVMAVIVCNSSEIKKLYSEVNFSANPIIKR